MFIQVTYSSFDFIGENNSYPALKATNNPSLTFAVNSAFTSATYSCVIDPSVEVGAVHKITWYVGTTQFKDETLPSGTTLRTLSSRDFTDAQRTTALNDGVS